MLKQRAEQYQGQTKNGVKPEPKNEDFVFRFSLLEESPENEIKYEDPLVEIVRGLIADLLDVAFLTYHGQRVRVDGFRLLQDPETQYEIFLQPASVTGQKVEKR